MAAIPAGRLDRARPRVGKRLWVLDVTWRLRRPAASTKFAVKISKYARVYSDNCRAKCASAKLKSRCGAIWSSWFWPRPRTAPVTATPGRSNTRRTASRQRRHPAASEPGNIRVAVTASPSATAPATAGIRTRKYPRCRHPSSGLAGSTTSLLPLILALRTCPRDQPSRSASVLGRCRCRLRHSRPPARRFSVSMSSCIPADAGLPIKLGTALGPY